MTCTQKLSLISVQTLRRCRRCTSHSFLLLARGRKSWSEQLFLALQIPFQFQLMSCQKCPSIEEVSFEIPTSRDESVSAFLMYLIFSCVRRSICGGSNEDIIRPLKFVTLLPHPTSRTSLIPYRKIPSLENEKPDITQGLLNYSLLSHQIKFDDLNSFVHHMLRYVM